jgi:DNA-directed RNA polymerase specialized sigma24 family protein
MHRTDHRTPDPLRSAFRDLHARRLYGFALLVTAGDRRRAAAASAAALRDGAERVDELRHPERGAAWLRSRVLRSIRGGRPASLAEGAAALRDLGVEEHTRVGLAALDHTARAVLVLADIERMDHRDVATVMGRTGPAVERLLQRARLRFAVAAARELPEDEVTTPTVERVRAMAARAMA